MRDCGGRDEDLLGFFKASYVPGRGWGSRELPAASVSSLSLRGSFAPINTCQRGCRFDASIPRNSGTFGEGTVKSG